MTLIDGYLETQGKIHGWVTDPQWKGTLLADTWISTQLQADVLAVISELDSAAIPTDRVEQILKDIRAKSKSSLDKAINERNSVNSWRSMRQAYGYYALGECITEASSYSETVIEGLKSYLGDDFLKELANFDRNNPSALTEISSLPKTHVKSASETEFAGYALLKRWQDDQHIYHEDVLFPAFRKTRDWFAEWIENNFRSLAGMNPTQALIVYDGLYQNQPLSIHAIISYMQADVLSDGDIRAAVGGKVLGIAKLAMAGAKVPETWIIPACVPNIDAYLPKIQSKTLWAVRSSATLEDGEKTSFAGIFESVLRVPRDNIADACSRVLASTSTHRVQEYIAAMKTGMPFLACLIQRFVEPDFAGVWLGSANAGGTLEWVDGDGEKLVSGRVTPKTEQWFRNCEPRTPWNVDSTPIGVACLEMEKKLRTEAADFEFCVKDDKMIWLQFRSVTQQVPIQKQLIDSLMPNEMRGRPASLGKAQGTAYVLEKPDQMMEDNGILICEVTDPDWLPVMTRASAIITAEGGVLCHAAITARELGKPCVVGLGLGILKLDKNKLKVNGNTGQVLIL